jgi:hypothetical protein
MKLPTDTENLFSALRQSAKPTPVSAIENLIRDVDSLPWFRLLHRGERKGRGMKDEWSEWDERHRRSSDEGRSE